MIISLSNIKPLKPCSDRFENYVKFYGDREFTKRQFMGLRNITHYDKLWVTFRLMTVRQAQLAALEIARSVLHVYEEKFPNDFRVRECLDATEGYLNGKVKIRELEEKRSAARTAAAAYAASDAAADAAYAAAAYAAWAAAADAAYAADAYSAYSAHAAYAVKPEDRTKFEKKVRTTVLKYWK